MRTLIGSRSRIITGFAFLFSILSISNSCTKSSMDNMYGMGGNTGSKGSPGTNEVWIQGMTFTPSIITVTAGTTITWTNKDGFPHTVTSTSSLDTFDSGSISSNRTFQHTFNTVGTITYKCTIHPSMTASVVVN